MRERAPDDKLRDIHPFIFLLPTAYRGAHAGYLLRTAKSTAKKPAL